MTANNHSSDYSPSREQFIRDTDRIASIPRARYMAQCAALAMPEAAPIIAQRAAAKAAAKAAEAEKHKQEQLVSEATAAALRNSQVEAPADSLDPSLAEIGYTEQLEAAPAEDGKMLDLTAIRDKIRDVYNDKAA